MLILEKLRNRAFWLVDAIKGGVVKRHYKEIKNTISGFGTEWEAKHTREKLDSLLKHAVATVPYYKDYAGKLLQDFPVMNKTIIRENQHLFLSDKYTENQLFPLITSGSTGTPFKIYQDGNKKKRNSADTIAFAERAGFKVGEKLVYLKIWSEYNKKSFLQKWMQNLVSVDVINLNDQIIADLIKQMETSKDTYGLLGYSSALELIAKYLEKNNHKVMANVRSIISMSESLNEYTKTTLPRYFDSPAMSRYSNIENGIIAQQERDGKTRFLINTASYYAEILEFDSDRPQVPGKLGRIVITDLYNYGMPMIRYDTGDIGAINAGSENYFDVIEGRKLDQIYATNGDLVSSYIVYKNMWQYTEIQQYQLVQYGPSDYLFKINAEGTFEREHQLVSEFKQYLGSDANFRVEYVDEIPLLASGKRKKIANTYHSQQ